MSVDLGHLYHWSPRENRESIQRRGLRIMSAGRPFKTHEGETTCVEFPWICLGTTPSTAWGLIADPDCAETWDLWQVQLRDGDHVAVRTDLDLPFIREIRVHNGLPADRVWWVAERSAGGPHC